jgi:hypothetical protein
LPDFALTGNFSEAASIVTFVDTASVALDFFLLWDSDVGCRSGAVDLRFGMVAKRQTQTTQTRRRSIKREE